MGADFLVFGVRVCVCVCVCVCVSVRGLPLQRGKTLHVSVFHLPNAPVLSVCMPKAGTPETDAHS